MTFGSSLSLDLSTLYLVATLVAAMLGGLLIHFWRQEQIPALGWWGAAYIVAGIAIAVWSLGGAQMHPALSLALNVTGIVACGMVWNAARIFHGKKTSVLGIGAGALLWAFASLPLPDTSSLRLFLGAGVVAAYAVLTAQELWLERRKAYKSRWPAVGIPAFHGLVLMLPLIIGDFMTPPGETLSVRSGWVAFFAIELVMYAVGTVFIIVMLVSERAVKAHKTAASIDPLTELFNRRGFSELCGRMIEREQRVGRPVAVLLFDIDHFKQVNDRFGHAAGDEILKLFGNILVHTLRITDVVGRIGGEEFAAMLACSQDEAVIAAERVRATYAGAGVRIDDTPLETSVSIGVACGEPGTDLQALLASADTALYRAKRAGRNRVEVASEVEGPVSLDKARKVAVLSRSPTIVHQFEGATDQSTVASETSA